MAVVGSAGAWIERYANNEVLHWSHDIEFAPSPFVQCQASLSTFEASANSAYAYISGFRTRDPNTGVDTTHHPVPWTPLLYAENCDSVTFRFDVVDASDFGSTAIASFTVLIWE